MFAREPYRIFLGERTTTSDRGSSSETARSLTFAVQNGLSRTERQLLAAGKSGARHRREFWLRSQTFEACPWGDASIYMRLDRLAAGHNPALDRLGADEFAINEQGTRLLAGEDDWLRSRNGTDVWLGGVHLTGPDGWRWSEDDQTLKTSP